MRAFATSNSETAIENFCGNEAITRKIKNSSKFSENSNWHDINNRKQEARSDYSKHDIH